MKKKELKFRPFDSFGGPLQRCIMPIIAKVDNQVFPIGTGFVIHSAGLLMTAAHVLVEAESKLVRRFNPSTGFKDYYELYALYLSDENNPETGGTVGGYIPIDHLWAPKELDIGFGWLNLPYRVETGKRFSLPSVKLRPGLPSLGDPIAAIGYYKMSGSMDGTLEKGKPVTKYAQNTAISSGKVIEVFPQFRDKGMMDFPCFRTDARFDPGMSGGPIFHESGSVIGVVCSSYPPSEDGDYISYGSLVWPALGSVIKVALEDGGPVQPITIYELATMGKIITDETLKNIRMVKTGDGKRHVFLNKSSFLDTNANE